MHCGAARRGGQSNGLFDYGADPNRSKERTARPLRAGWHACRCNPLFTAAV